MSRYDKAPFDPKGRYAARRTFTYNGITYSTGRTFDWRHIACSARKLKLLYDGGFIIHEKTKAPKAAKKPAKKKKAKKTAEEKPEVEVAEDHDIEAFLHDQE